MKTSFNPTLRRLSAALTVGFLTVSTGLLTPQTAEGGFMLVEDFDNYNTGNLNANPNPTGGVWNPLSNSQFATIAQQDDNKYLAYGWSNPNAFRGAYRGLGAASLAADGVGTYFLQFRANVANPDHSFGLTDMAVPGENFEHFRAQLAVVADPANSGKVRMGARQASGFTELQGNLDVGAWFNVWMVVNNNSNTYDVYFSTDPMGSATLLAQDMTFRIGTTNPLTTFMALGRTASTFTNSDRGLHIDNIYFSEGVNLVNPIPEPSTCALLFGAFILATVMIRRRSRKG